MHEDTKCEIQGQINKLLDDLPDDFMMLYVSLTADRAIPGKVDEYEQTVKWALIVENEHKGYVIDDTDVPTVKKYNMNGEVL